MVQPGLRLDPKPHFGEEQSFLTLIHSRGPHPELASPPESLVTFTRLHVTPSLGWPELLRPYNRLPTMTEGTALLILATLRSVALTSEPSVTSFALKSSPVRSNRHLVLPSPILVTSKLRGLISFVLICLWTAPASEVTEP